MGKNVDRLGMTLGSRMSKSAKAAVPLGLQLGIINSNRSLTVDGIDGAIPDDEYMVSLHLTHQTYQTTGGDTLPSVFRKLKPGDRVLVSWVGNEPIIIDIVVPGDTKSKG